MPRGSQPTPWAALITMVVIIVYSTVLILYLTVTGRITTLLPTIVGNVTVTQGGMLKVRVIAYGAAFKITGVAPCRLTGVFINNTQAPLTPPWILRSGQSAVFILSDCANVSQVVVAYDNGRVLIIPIKG